MLAMALEFFDYVAIMVIVSAFGAGASVVFGAQDQARLERLEMKVDLLLEHAGIELPKDAVLPEDVRVSLQENDESAK